MADRSYRWLFWAVVLCGTTLDQAGKYGVFKWLYQAPLDAYVIDEPRDFRRFGYVLIPGVFDVVAEYKNEEEATSGPLSLLRTYSSPKVHAVNHGALWGLGRNYETLANGTFALISVLAAVAIIYWSTRTATARDRFLCLALGLILAGTLGNLYDRLVFNGVRDFLYFHWFEFPVFNIADSCLVCGAGLLLTQAFLTRPAKETSAAPAAAIAGVDAK